MKLKITNLQKTLYLVSVIVLLSGLSSAIVVYWTAADNTDSSSGYEVMGGNIYPTEPGNTKKYTHDLQLYGGTAAVLADEFSRWFKRLWYGKSLAFTIVCIASFLSVVIFLAAKYVSSDSPSDGNGES